MRLRGGEEQLMAVARGNGAICNDTFFVELQNGMMACWRWRAGCERIRTRVRTYSYIAADYNCM